MPSTPKGDFIYVNFLALLDLEVYVSIKPAIDEGTSDVICSVTPGDTILFRHPNKMFVSFKSKALESKFYMQAYYSSTVNSDSIDNERRCSDKGSSLGL